MGRKNKRKRNEYRDRLGFNPNKYICRHTAQGVRITGATGNARTEGGAARLNRDVRRGDIWFADLDPHPGTSVQGGCRPVLIISNDIGNYHADTLNVLPMTRHLKKPELPCHAMIDPTDVADLHQQMDISMLLAEQITTIDKAQLRNFAGRVLDTGLLRRIDRAVMMQLGLACGLDTDLQPVEDEP